MSGNNIDLILRLSHDLGVALEMNCEPVELRELWADSLDTLVEAQETILAAGLTPPAVIANVIRSSRE
jgi:hypothetical protein